MANKDADGVPIQVTASPFAFFLWGGKEKFEIRRNVLQTLTESPIFSKKAVNTSSLARKDAWTRIATQSRELVAIKLRCRWSNAQFMDAIAMTDWMMPIHPQFRIFISNLERQMSDEQKKLWIPKAQRFEIFGCYCQTELGHGSNVRGIETIATFAEDTDEFIINSPSLSSTKFWIGAAGVWATHGIVAAKLIIRDQDFGNHLFLTQLRHLDTHHPMPGIEIYEQGPKAFQGMLGTDNGAIRFHHVRIPRSQMLARSAQVLRDGTYVRPKNSKHAYGSMITVRALMAETTGWDLLKAIVVSYHYTRFRRQFKKTADEKEETCVFDYASVKYRLLPLLCQATALIRVGQNIKRAYDEYTVTMLTANDYSQLEDLHLQTVCAKVYSTEIASRGVEISRIACGGHGYSALSGFGRMYAHTVNAVTYEGDNYVISQQVTKAIVKYHKSQSHTFPPTLTYLQLLKSGESPQLPIIDSAADWLSRSVQKWALESRLAVLVHQHLDDENAGRDTSYNSHAITMAHSDYVYWNGLWREIEALDASKAPFTRHVQAVAQVFSLSILYNPHHSVIGHALRLSASQLLYLRQAYATAIEDFAENHTDALVKAYGLTEYELDSALARTNQSPYEALFEGAQRSEMSGQQMSHMWPMLVETRRLWIEANGDVEHEGLKGRVKL